MKKTAANNDGQVFLVLPYKQLGLNVLIEEFSAEIETLQNDGSNSEIYIKLMNHKSANNSEERFKKMFENAIQFSDSDLKDTLALGILIFHLMANGMSEEEAWNAVCGDGHSLEVGTTLSSCNVCSPERIGSAINFADVFTLLGKDQKFDWLSIGE